MHSNRASSHQELIPSSSSSPSRNQHQQNANSRTDQNQHAFGADSDDENNSDSDDDDGLGFQVYKDQASNARYTNVASVPTTPSAQPFSMASAQQTAPITRAPPTYHYPPEEQQPHHQMPIPHSNPAYKPAASDLVHMPALGSDWTKDEGKRDKDWEGKDTLINKTKWLDRKEKMRTKKASVDSDFRDFLAGRRNIGGWFNRFMALGLLIILLLLGTLLAYFVVPRIPEVAYDNKTTLTGDSTNGLSFQTLEPVRFEFNGKINLAMTAKSSYVKPQTSSITVIIKDLSSSGNPVEVARGTNSNSVSIDTKDYTPFSVDLNFRYSASSSKDPVWTAWHEACGHKWPGKEDRPKLQIGIIVQWSLKGRIGTYEERTILNDFLCPVELPANAA